MKKVKWEKLNEQELQKVEGGAKKSSLVADYLTKVYRYFLKK